MRRALAGFVWVAAVAALPGVAPVYGQGTPIRVTAVQGLTFGNVIPGVPAPIARTDPTGSGRLDIRAHPNEVVQLRFTLPTSMSGPAGASLPLTFGASDGGFSSDESIASQIGFDPRTATSQRVSKNGRGSVFLGGTANPSPTQRAGTYSATITLTVSYPGT
jgi:hypothetical protein